MWKISGGSSKSAEFDREQAAKIAPGYNLAQEDVLIKHLQAEEGLHGLGYQVGFWNIWFSSF